MGQKRKGQTLVEVTMAALIAAITAMATFSVILSSFTSQKRTDKREAAGFLIKQAQETLKSYVTAVPGESRYVPNGGQWLDSTWALAPGEHDISALLADTAIEEGGTFTYTVENFNCLGIGDGPFFNVSPDDANQCKMVRFDLSYTD